VTGKGKSVRNKRSNSGGKKRGKGGKILHPLLSKRRKALGKSEKSKRSVNQAVRKKEGGGGGHFPSAYNG